MRQGVVDHESGDVLTDETDEDDEAEDDSVEFEEGVESVRSKVASRATCRSSDAREWAAPTG